ncbi:MAG: APC family permease, partial [Chloroflexota bacterium]
ASILLTATNAGLMGISRLTFNMSSHHQLPATLGRVHPRFRTPYIAIILFCLLALAVLTPGFVNPHFFADLGALYVFGSLLAFTLAHAAIISLRVKKPDMPRPFRLRGNLRIRERELPVTAILGLLATFTIWLVVIITQPYSRWAGLAWMAIGLLVFFLSRRKSRPPLPVARKDIVDSR